MRLLFVTPEIPYPPRKGYMLQAYEHMKYLSARHEIDLLCFSPGSTAQEDLGDLSGICRSIKQVPLPQWRRWANLALGAMSGDPFQVHYYRSANMKEEVNSQLRNPPDVVVFQLIRMAQFLPVGYDRPALLNMVDPLTLNYERSLAWRPWFTRGGLRMEISRLRKYERINSSRFERVLLAAEPDVADYTAILPGCRVEQVPHCVDTGFFAPTVGARKPNAIVITGNMGYPPNIDAVHWFCGEILPIIRGKVPDARLCIAGARPSAGVLKWGKLPYVQVTGLVEDIRPFLSEAMVSVCPVRLKVGTQTKVLEAMAMGTPVVTTSAGNNGVQGVSGEHLYVADAPADFAAKVVELLGGHRWAELSSAGRTFVEARHSWQRSGEKLERILLGIVRDGSARTKT